MQITKLGLAIAQLFRKKEYQEDLKPTHLIHNFDQLIRFTDGKKFDTTEREIADRESNGMYYAYHGPHSRLFEDKNSPPIGEE